MMREESSIRSRRFAWLLLIVLLLTLRAPSLVQPAGGDQGLYVYAARQWRAGAVPYRDFWDQKPPGVAAVYAILSSVWPHQSVVPAADLAASAATASLLILIGRRRFSETVGFAAAAVFLLFGDPSFTRLAGVYVRGQCEPFIALAITGALAILAAPSRTTIRLSAVGLCLAAAFWLKYNAAVYVVPVLIALWAWRPSTDDGLRTVRRDGVRVVAAGAAFSALVAAYFALNGALRDLWLATVIYNLRYSEETYAGFGSIAAYFLRLPFERARVDMLWFLGMSGAAFLAWCSRRRDSLAVPLAWVAAAMLSVTINGQRDLPNYFVQANPALALAAAGGFAAMLSRGRWRVLVAAAALVMGFWRVGAEGPRGTVRLAGLPGLARNLRFDLAYVRGDVDRGTYLSRFRGVKYDAVEIDEVSRYLRATTSLSEPVYVFGFLGGSICWLADRVSASRFFWSHPVLIEFASSEPGYGSAGVLIDLQQRRPAVVALQEEQWKSRSFFMRNEPLARWLTDGYVLERETAMFAIWRRKP
jgi:hypothetical protein